MQLNSNLFLIIWYYVSWLSCSYFIRDDGKRIWDCRRFFLSLLNKLEKFLFLFLHLLSKTCERLQCIATEFLFLWSNLIHVKSCNALRGCFETLEEKQQFSRIWKKHSEWRDVKPGPNSNLLFSGTFNYWWLAVFMFTSQVECSLWSFCLCPAPLPVIYFHCKWLPRLVINHDQGINVDLWKLAITPLDILLKTRGNLANNHDDCAYWNLNDKKILTSPGYAWVMNSVSFAVTYIEYNLSMKQYVLQCIDSLSTSPCNDSEWWVCPCICQERWL